MIIKKSIKAQAAILITVAIILITLFTNTINYINTEKLYEEMIVDEMNILSNNTKNYLDTWFELRVGLVESLRGSFKHIDIENNPETAIKIMQEYYSKYPEIEIYGGLDSGVYLDASGWEPPGDYDHRERGWYEAAKGSGVTIMSEPYLDADTGTVVISISTPILNEVGKMVGVIAADVNLREISRFIGSLNLQEGISIIVIDHEDNIIIHENSEMEPKEESNSKVSDIGNNELTKLIGGADTTHTKLIKGNGEDSIYLKSTTKDNWRIVVKNNLQLRDEINLRNIKVALMGYTIPLIAVVLIMVLVERGNS